MYSVDIVCGVDRVGWSEWSGQYGVVRVGWLDSGVVSVEWSKWGG